MIMIMDPSHSLVPIYMTPEIRITSLPRRDPLEHLRRDRVG